LNRQALFHLSIFTLVGFSLIANIALHFHPSVTFWSLFESESPILHTFFGLGMGLVASGLGLLLLQIKGLQSTNTSFTQMLEDLDLQWYHILFYSFCAGVGEEILFRGAMQAYLYIWPTAIIFVLIHGYINPKDLKMSLFGVFLILISAGFGYLMKHESLYAAMAAHFMYDVVMFSYLKYQLNKNK
jgi:membrane protease YdiL (CAAX protease family)